MEDNQFDAESAVSDYLTGNNVTAARAGVAFSAEANPDYEAHIKAVAQRNGVPIDTVREHPEEMKVQDKLGAINFDELATKNPVTTSTLGDFDKAKIVHDDIDNLSTMETALQFGKNAASTLAAGAYAGTAGALGAVEAVMKNTGDLVDPLIPEGYNPLYKQAEALQDLRHNQEAWRDYYKPGAETILGKGLVSGGMSLAQNIPLLAAAIYTRNPSLVLPTMTTQSFGQSYGEDVDKGMSTPAATIHAGANAAIEYGTEAWGINKLFGDLNAGSSILKTMMHQIVPEVVGEQAATALQGLNDWLVQHPEKPVKEYLSTMPAAAAETLVATMVGMGGNTALLKTVEGVQKVSNIDFRKAKKSENTALNIEQLNKVVAASKVLQRDPTIIHDFATEVSENGPVQNLYINAETLMQSGVAQKLSELLPSITEENIAEALATGGELKIPIADYVTHIAGTDLAPELVDHLRVEGEDYTRAEAKDYMTNHASEMQAHVERVMAENQVTDEFKASADRVKASVLEQLNSLGRFSKTKNEFDATLYTAYVTTRAKQLGITPEEMYEKHKVTFAAESLGGQQYNQGDGYPLAHRDEWYGEGTFKEDGGRMVHVTPDEYLAVVKPLTMDDESRENIDLLKEHILNGNTLDPLLIRANGKEDGRHRAYAAKELGISHVPVIDYGNYFKDAPEVNSQTYKQSGLDKKVLLSPNGKPSNLNSMQYAQVRTEAFKKWFGDWETAATLNWLDTGNPVASMEGDEIPTLKGIAKLADWIAQNWIERKETIINRSDLGEINIDRKSVKDSAAHGLSKTKVQGYYLVPDVIREGKILGTLPHQAGKPDAIIIAAPVKIGASNYKMYVEVRHDANMQRMYVHEVVLNAPTTAFKTAAEVPEGSKLHSANRGAIFSFLQNLRDVKSSKVIDENGEPLVVYHTRQKGNNFTEFKNGTAGLIWFADSKKGSGMAALGEGDLVEAYLNAKSPFNTKATAVHFGRIPGTEFNEDLGRITSVLEKTGDDLIYVEDESGIAYAVQNANQIKSATENNGDFNQNDANIYHQSNKNLALVHNLSLENLLHANKLGGIPVPSVAVVNKDHPMDAFGEITLIANKDNLGPQASAKNRFFNADIYSPRYPNVTYIGDRQAIDDANSNLSEAAKKIQEADGSSSRITADRLEDGITKGLQRNLALQYQYLESLGKAPAITYKPKTKVPKALQKFIKSDIDLRGKEFWKAAIDDWTDRHPDVSAEDVEWISTSIRSDAIDAIEKVRKESKTGKVIDINGLRTKITSKLDYDKFRQWLTENYSNLIKDEKIFDGYTDNGKKYLPHNLDTVVKLMTKTVRGGENFNYGVGSIRAHAAKQFKTIKSLQDAREDLISKDKMDELADEIKLEFESLTEALAPYRNEDAGYSNQSSEALADLASKGLRGFQEYYRDVPEDVMNEVYDFMNQLKNMPSHYFEGKIGRAVGIHEFDGAIVPEGKGYEAAVSLLKERGITNIKRYNPRIDESRAKALGSFNDLFFQNNIEKNRGSFNPSTNTITALKDADLSTMLHEMGHYFFEADIALASELSSLPFISKGEQTIIDDVSALFTWHGLQGDIHDQLNQWHSMSFEERRSYHEKTAESFEHYLLTGKAPSLELQRSFQTFRSWLIGVYKSIKDFIKTNPQAGTLSPEVRAVFDRMLASEEQIKLAEQGRSMMPLFESAEQAGMTEQEFAEYQQLGEDATNAAIDVLSSKATGDMQWLSNARAKSLKKMQRQHDELRRNVRSEVRSKVMSQPVYQAWSFLTRKLSKDDKITPQERPKSNPNYVDESQDTLFVAIAKLGGLRRDDIESEWGLDPATRSPMPVFGKHVLRRKGGMAIDDMGQRLMEHGYLTPDEHGKFWQGEFEEKFNNELRGQLEYSTGFHSDVFAEEGKAGQQIANPWALSAGRIELSALKGMMLPTEMEQRIIDLKMTSKNGLDADVVSDIIPGFSSGDELIRAIAGAENPRELVERMTDQTMLERHSELATPEAIQKAADEAIHNDVRARFITREANALAQATGGTKLLASAARDYATSIIGRLKIRNIKPHQYTLAETRAAKLSEKASKDGDLKKAAAEKRNQAINLYAAKAAYDALDEVDKILRYFKKFNGDNKKVDIEYLDQIRGLLAKFDLRKQSGAQIDETVRLRSWVQSRLAEGELPIVAETLLSLDERRAYVAQIESRDEHGELVYADDEERLKLLADAIDRSATRSYKEATFEELQGLNDTIKQIEHIGRLKNKLLTAQDKRNFEAIRDEITDSIMEHGGLGNKNTRTPNDILGKALVGIKSFGADHIKVATWARIMDGGLDNGPVWRFLIKPANERATQETSMRAKATAELDAILRPILKKASYYDKSLKGKFFASIGDSLLWQERFTILLNMGNESNLQRLMAGGISGKVGQLTMSQILDVVNTMSPEEIHAAQAVWDHFESYRPKIAEKELRVSGVEPKWIPIRAIDIKANDGSIVHLRGGYYPVKFDSRVNIRAEAHASAQEAKDLMKASYSAATTNRSFTKERVEEVHGRPLLLNMTGLYSGVNDVIHDLAWHEWVIDANKMLRSSKIDEAIRAFYGPEVKKQFDTWRNDIVVGQRRLDHGIEKAAGIARQFVSGSALTFNLLSAAMQPLGLSNSIARIGAEWIGKGVSRYTANPIQATIEAQAKSEWMANRTRTRFRELNELRNQVQGQTAAKEIMGRYGYWLMMKSQMTVDVPTWWGGYEKGIAEGHDEATAIALADQGVKDSQGGGEEVDQSGIERGNALVKLFTAFYGFMGTTLNTAVGSTITEKSKAKIAANLLLTLMVPAVFGSLLKDALTPDGGDDDEGLAEKLIREQISFLMGMIAFGREFAQMANPKSTGYSGPTGLRVIPDIYHLGEQIKQGEFDDAFRKQFINVLGDFTGIPAVQVNRTITGTKALVEGKTDNPMAIGFGFKNK